MTTLTYTSICRNNGLIIFDALAADELQTGRRLYSDVTDHTNAIGRSGYCTRYEVQSRAALHAALMAVLYECQSGILKPILHFEGHGDPEKGLFIAASQEYILWADLKQLVELINRATLHNSGVVVAACFGFSLSRGLEVAKPSPFNFLIAPSIEMSAGTFRDAMYSFYKAVASNGDLRRGLADLPQDMQLLVSGEWFYSTIGSYLVHHHTQKDRQEMIEQVVTRQLTASPALNRAERRARLKQVRQSAKARINDAKGFVQHFAKTFFHGHPPVEMQDFQVWVSTGKNR